MCTAQLLALKFPEKQSLKRFNTATIKLSEAGFATDWDGSSASVGAALEALYLELAVVEDELSFYSATTVGLDLLHLRELMARIAKVSSYETLTESLEVHRNSNETYREAHRIRQEAAALISRLTNSDS
jgi:hypothetical protein